MDELGHPPDGSEETPVEAAPETQAEATESTPPAWHETASDKYRRDTVEETLAETEKARAALESQFTKARQDDLEQRLMGQNTPEPEPDTFEQRVQPTASTPSNIPPEAIQAAIRAGYSDPAQAEAAARLFMEMTPLFAEKTAGKVFDAKANAWNEQQQEANRAQSAKDFLGTHPDIAQDPQLAQDWFNRVMGEGGHNVHSAEDAYYLATRPRQIEAANAKESRRQEDANAGAGITPIAPQAGTPRSNDPLDWMDNGIPTGEEKII